MNIKEQLEKILLGAETTVQEKLILGLPNYQTGYYQLTAKLEAFIDMLDYEDKLIELLKKGR